MLETGNETIWIFVFEFVSDLEFRASDLKGTRYV